MKLHIICFAVVAVLLVKLVVGVNTSEMMFYLACAAFGAFLIGCLAKSFAYDREHGETTTRDAMILFGVWHLGTGGFVVFCGLIAAVIIYFTR